MYTILQDTANKITIPFNGTDYDFILIVFTYSCYESVGIFENTAEAGCDYEIVVNEVGTDGTSDPENGDVKISPRSTWKAEIYGQDNNVNLFPVYAAFIDEVKVQVKGDNCFKYPTQSPNIDCADGIVENTDESFQERVASGGTLVLEDYDFELQDPDGVVISNTPVPAMIAAELIVGANGLCPTEFEYNLNINGVFQQVVTVDTFSDINITLK